MANKTISAANSTWNGTSKQDKVYIQANYVKISTGKGNDSIYSGYSWNNTINTGEGNDTINSQSYDVKIDAGAGNDSIYSWGNRGTIKGGTGNDTITLDSYDNVIQYASGDGNDIIYGLGSTDTISITGAKYTKKTSGSDVIVTVGKGKITLVGAKGKDFTIKGTLDGGGKNINNSKAKKLLTGTSYVDTINNTGDYVTINGGKGNDTIVNNGTKNIYKYANDDGKDVIYGFGEDDTIKITGAKYTKKTSGNDVILTVGKGKITLKDAKGKTLNIDGTLNGKLNIPTNTYTYNGHSYYIFNNKSTWEEAKTYCESRGGHLAVINNAKENSALFKYMKSKGYDSAYFGISDAANEGTWTWANGDSSTYRNWASNEPNGGTYENYGMFYNVYQNGEWNDGDFGSEGINIFICEWDTVTTGGGTSTVTVPADTVPSGDVLKGTNGHDNLSNGTGWNLSTGAGKVIYGYGGNDTITNYANNVYISGGNGNDYITSNYGSNSTVHGDAGADNITVSSNNAFVYGDDGNDKITAYKEGNFIYGGKGDDYIRTENNNNGYVDGGAGDDTITAYKGTFLTLSGGAGNDSLWGGANSDTLIGGSGDDIFVYKPDQGTDHITDFSGGDMLKILKSNGSAGGTFTSATFSGGNLTLAINGGGKVVLDNVSSGQSININGSNYKISGGTLK